MNMVGAEIMNRSFRPGFVSSKEKGFFCLYVCDTNQVRIAKRLKPMRAIYVKAAVMSAG